MEKVCLSKSTYDEYMLNSKLIGSGIESLVYLLGSEVLKIFLEPNITEEDKLLKLANIKGLDSVLTMPTKILYLNDTFIGFVMKYAGIDLKRYFMINNISFDKKVAILRRIKNKLELLHSKGIVHGDLQLKNIMIYRNQIKICDVTNVFYHKSSSPLLNDMTLYLAKYLGYSELLDKLSLNYITYVLLNCDRKEEVEYLEMDACGYTNMFERDLVNRVFVDEVFSQQMEYLMYPKEAKQLEKNAKYLIDYVK